MTQSLIELNIFHTTRYFTILAIFSPATASAAPLVLLLEIVFEIRITRSFIPQLFPDFQYGAFNLNI